MGQHTYQKRFSSADRQPAEVSSPEGLHYSNSALAAMTGADSPSGNNLSDIHDSIMQRFSAPVRESVQAQIPTAEAEADRLSASVKSGSPDAVKAAMGRRMGADFSGVRFHTGKAAEAKASAVDARAYTSGNDVYFGEGGFDPAVAAHELVHTAQQGMVAAATPTVATPVGGVQRKPKLANARAYKKDTQYQNLITAVDEFNNADSPEKKAQIESMLRLLAEQYISTAGTMHKGRQENVRNMIAQIDADKAEARQKEADEAEISKAMKENTREIRARRAQEQEAAAATVIDAETGEESGQSLRPLDTTKQEALSLDSGPASYRDDQDYQRLVFLVERYNAAIPMKMRSRLKAELTVYGKRYLAAHGPNSRDPKHQHNGRYQKVQSMLDALDKLDIRRSVQTAGEDDSSHVVDKAVDATVGRFSRWHDEAIDELYAAKQSGDWKELSKEQKAAWKSHNQLAYRAYKADKAGTGVRREAEYRQKERALLDESVGKFLARFWKRETKKGTKFSFLDDQNEVAQEKAVDGAPVFQVSEAESNFSNWDLFLQYLGWGADIIGVLTDILDIADQNMAAGYTNMAEDINNIRDLVEHLKNQDKKAVLTDLAKISLVSLTSIGNFLQAVTKKVSVVGGVMGGGFDVFQGGREVYAGSKQKSAMTSAQDQFLTDGEGNKQTRDQTSGKNLVGLDAAKQGHKHGSARQAEGVGKSVEGVLTIVDSASPDVTVKAVAKALKYLSKGITAAVTVSIHNSLKGDVAKQTAGIDDDLIKKYLDRHHMEHTSRNIREVKRSMMRCMGYKTGYREELLADQTEKRVNVIAEESEANNAPFRTMTEGLGVHLGEGKTKFDEHDKKTMQKNLGSKKSRDEISGSTFSLHAMAEANRKKKQPQSATS